MKNPVYFICKAKKWVFPLVQTKWFPVTHHIHKDNDQHIVVGVPSQIETSIYWYKWSKARTKHMTWNIKIYRWIYRNYKNFKVGFQNLFFQSNMKTVGITPPKNLFFDVRVALSHGAHSFSYNRKPRWAQCWALKNFLVTKNKYEIKIWTKWWWKKFNIHKSVCLEHDWILSSKSIFLPSHF